ncbi:thiolase family protein [Pararhizobium mangrovi]|uniref:Thiolase family protein n=1 Tax=Pararhizobium mangrovi TaxID=2590452 RepID=A0A506UEQ2_9HYPH|nr:thiolase family protein [Pararhizobium mangrovi]TPW30217.1 thiolase family protein [Pararhizobium mangrovi]
MAPTSVEIPYRAYWATPFAKWQGSLSHLHSLKFAAHVAKTALTDRSIDPSVFDFGVLGTTVPQQGCFYGLPWVTGLLGAEHVAGPTIAQACATGARILCTAFDEIAAGRAGVALAIAADRVSNGPQLYHPDPEGPGGAGRHEAWVLDNFERDPWAGCAMVDTAENVAARYGIGLKEQHDLVLRRYAQYDEALANDRAFQRRYMTLPFEVPDARFQKTRTSLEGDEGIYPTTPEKLARQRPVREGGTVSLAAQTHPADGNAAIVLAAPEKARDLSSDPAIRVTPLAFGQSREAKGYMPAAPIEAARRALAQAGLGIADMDAIKAHNPFVVNDIAFARAFDIDVARMNNFGCSLVWGHPQAPTGVRAIIELIEELVLRGGGIGLFEGCAAGDSAMAMVVKVEERRS